MKLNEICDNPGATKVRKRIGRGAGSGTGGTAGRGHKGQKSRSGVSLLGFEGGQMPLYRRLPKRGFKNPFTKDFAEINLGRLQKAVDDKKIKPTGVINEEVLRTAGLIKGRYDGVKLLAKGDIKAKLTLEVHGASKAALAAIEKSGGKVVILASAVKEEDKSQKEGEAKAAPKDKG